MFQIAMDPDIYRLVALTILFLFFSVAVAAISPVGLPTSAGTPGATSTDGT